MGTKLDEYYAGLAQEATLPLTRAAQKHGGTLTVAQAVLATGLNFVEAEKCLLELVKTGYVRVENTEDGNLLFDFGELPEYDEEEAARHEEEEAQVAAAYQMEEMMEEAERAERRAENRTLAKRGLFAGAVMFGARMLFGDAFDDDE